MKIKIVSVFILFAVVAGCDTNVVLIDEVPDKIIPTKPCATLYQRFNGLFPEFVDNESRQSILFADSVQKNLILTQDSEVYLSFISEGATLQNTFGWYAFSRLEIPQNSNDIELHLLFPNVSNKILAAGDRLQLGGEKFKAGTVIGFFLIADGWQNGIIDYNKHTVFSTSSFNIDQLQQHILFIEKSCGDLVLSFEDISVNSEDCDHDFNDIIFTLSDNNSNLVNTSFDQHQMVKL